MEEGFIIDEGYRTRRPEKWVQGPFEFSIWTGLKLRGRQQLQVTTYRCDRCGYLESYA
jgi:hypothetical protein